MAKTVKIKNDKGAETPSAKIFWAFMYLLLICVIIFSACFIYDRTYYTPFYVDGDSMLPTLNKNVSGNQYEFGIEDEHKSVIKTIQRYDLIITYYHGDFNDGETPKDHSVDNIPNKKIKRVIGMPNDKIIIKKVNDHNEIWLENEETRQDAKENNLETSEIKLDLPFVPNNKLGLDNAIFKNNEAAIKQYYLANGHSEADATKLAKAEAKDKTSFAWTLKDDEVFAMGDNWGNSNDCTNPNVGPITFDYISGVVIKIQGYLTIENGIAKEKNLYDEPRYYKK